jgi:hypothetical protein
MTDTEKAKWYRTILVGAPGLAKMRRDQLDLQLRDHDSDLLRGMFLAYSDMVRELEILAQASDAGWADKCGDSTHLSLLAQPEESC